MAISRFLTSRNYTTATNSVGSLVRISIFLCLYSKSRRKEAQAVVRCVLQPTADAGEPLFALDDGGISFTYYIDHEAFANLQKDVLGRKILVTNRHEWTSEEVILAYRGQAKVEYAFRTIKNPYHLAIRPQYHWTDQKIKVHFLICIIGYLLTMVAYMKAKEKAGYQKNIN